MTDTQLYLAIGVPIVLNTAMFGLVFLRIKTRFDALDQCFKDTTISRSPSSTASKRS